MASANNYDAQPLLAKPQNQPSHTKFLFLALLLVALVVVIVAPMAYFFTQQNLMSTSKCTPLSISQVCKNAHDPSSCLAMVTEATSSSNNNGAGEVFIQPNNVEPLKLFLAKSKPHIQSVLNTANNGLQRGNNIDERDRAAVVDCVELMELSMGRVVDSLDALTRGYLGSYDDVHAWLSGVLTNHFTCLDGLSGSARAVMEPGLNELIARARASLAMLVAMKPTTTTQEEMIKVEDDGFPSWLTSRDRKLLGAEDVQPDAVVAQDGSGNYKTLEEAVASAPNNSRTRYVIYVKKGTYKVVHLVIASNKRNIMLVGDGMDLTIITGSLNFVDNGSTFASATVAATGDGFMARDIWFQNTAGPEKHQAVALRVGADESVIYRCKIEAYQDSLYPHSQRQFYRDSIAIGTIDFVFGNAAAVFQNCKLIARKPMAHQSNMVTAQGREDPNQNTGYSIQNCEIIASSDLEPVKGSFKTYLGRPWKTYSRTVVMQSYIGDLIDPAGWFPWSGTDHHETCYYGEYANRGPGSDTSRRVTWPGFHVITSAAVASQFTVAQLIQGGSWIEPTGVSFTEGLYELP
ncbi:hypothetical protein Dimus_035137 [Dionaea muscipula]